MGNWALIPSESPLVHIIADWSTSSSKSVINENSFAEVLMNKISLVQALLLLHHRTSTQKVFKLMIQREGKDLIFLPDHKLKKEKTWNGKSFKHWILLLESGCCGGPGNNEKISATSQTLCRCRSIMVDCFNSLWREKWHFFHSSYHSASPTTSWKLSRTNF